MNPLRYFFALCIVLAASAGTADACAVCFQGEGETRSAFLITTIFMTAMPFVLVGCFLAWYKVREKSLVGPDR